MKKLLMALVVAAPVALGLGGVTAAEAKPNVTIYLGVPHYGYKWDRTMCIAKDMAGIVLVVTSTG